MAIVRCGNEHRIDLPRGTQQAVVGKFCPRQILNGIEMTHTQGGHLDTFELLEHAVISASHSAQPHHANADRVHTHSFRHMGTTSYSVAPIACSIPPATAAVRQVFETSLYALYPALTTFPTPQCVVAECRRWTVS